VQQVQDSSHAKRKTEKEDRLPLQISCESSLLAEAIASLPAAN